MTRERCETDSGTPEGLKNVNHDELDIVFARANPNPSRVGCPGRNVLLALARRKRALGDPAYEHLTKCSPCYREFRAIQADASRGRLWSACRWAAAAAAVLAILAGSTWLAVHLRDRASGAPADGHQAGEAAVLTTELDLRTYTVTRSDQTAAAKVPVLLHAARLNMTILLPVGSEPGRYQVRLFDADRRSRASETGTAKIINYVTTLHVPIDLTSLPAGWYQLAFRSADEDWHLVPARVQ